MLLNASRLVSIWYLVHSIWSPRILDHAIQNWGAIEPKRGLPEKGKEVPRVLFGPFFRRYSKGTTDYKSIPERLIRFIFWDAQAKCKKRQYGYDSPHQFLWFKIPQYYSK